MLSTLNKNILKIAVPSIISNITIPLLGLVDVMVVGHLGSPAYIGAIAVGGMLFNIIYWIFGFLKMGTGGLTSQAYGKHDFNEVTSILVRSLGVGLSIAATLLVLQYPIQQIAFYFIDTTPEIKELSMQYFRVCIWGAPAVLGLYGFSGWFIGMQNTRTPMVIAITQNLVNISSSLLFVYVFDMEIRGVALGTLLSQYVGLFLAYVMWMRYYGRFKTRVNIISSFKKQAMSGFFRVNKDIFLRTICLVSVTVFFTSSGAAQGELILAVNTLLMQLFTLFSYIMDGFAHAGEAISGKYYGAGNRKALQKTIKQLFKWGIALSLVFTVMYAVGGNAFIGLLTDNIDVKDLTKDYFYWVLAVPFTGFSAFLLDGIFIGLTATKLMLRAMFIASVVFFGVYYCFVESLGNHALWLAFISYLTLRGAVQGLSLRGLGDRG
ncbi:MAG: MATE family efflux transporter [Rikenellaceae bacterium]